MRLGFKLFGQKRPFIQTKSAVEHSNITTSSDGKCENKTETDFLTEPSIEYKRDNKDRKAEFNAFDTVNSLF